MSLSLLKLFLLEVSIVVRFSLIRCHAQLHNMPPSQKFSYLYAERDNPHASHPVVDHMAPADRNQPSDLIDRPDFLFNATGTYRLVEFYVHWCDICKNFKPHYVALAQRVQQLANVTVEVHAISCAPNRPLCRHLGVDRYPLFQVFAPGDSIGLDVPHHQVNPVTVLAKMGIEIDQEDEDDWKPSVPTRDAVSWWDTALQWWNPPKHVAKFEYRRSRDELRHDVHLSFDYAMRQGVFMSNDPLSQQKAKVLLSWFKLLRVTLPPSWKSMHALVRELIVNFDYVKRSEDFLIATLEEHPPPSQIWSMACSRGDPDVGYSCGLWEIFHVVTVGVVDFNRGAAFSQSHLATAAVATTIRNYIESFFGCDVCRKNFIEAFDKCAHERCRRLRTEDDKGTYNDWVELPLWLFETHNAVNVRLMHEKATRENRNATRAEAISVMWPTVDACERCWNKNMSFDKAMMSMYLKLEYGIRDSLSSTYEEEIFEPTTGSMREGNVSTIFEYTSPTSISTRMKGMSWWTLVSTFLTRDKVKSTEEKKADITIALDKMMRTGVFGNSTSLSKEKKETFQDWLYLLQKAIPASWFSTHDMLKELLDNFSYVAKSKDYLVAVLDDFPPAAFSLGQRKEKQEYSNGVWDMLQLVTIGVVQYNRGVAKRQRFSIRDVAHTLAQVVSLFLDAEPWIIQMFQNCETKTCERFAKKFNHEGDWKVLPLWLIHMRYLANSRLSTARNSGTLSFRSPPYDCTGCRFENGQMNEEFTFDFLCKEYAKLNSSIAALESEL